MHKLENTGNTHLSHRSQEGNSCLPDVQIHAEAFTKFRCLQKVYQYVSENYRDRISLR
jgi:hypothetical protein